MTTVSHHVTAFALVATLLAAGASPSWSPTGRGAGRR